MSASAHLAHVAQHLAPPRRGRALSPRRTHTADSAAPRGPQGPAPSDGLARARPLAQQHRDRGAAASPVAASAARHLWQVDDSGPSSPLPSAALYQRPRRAAAAVVRCLKPSRSARSAAQVDSRGSGGACVRLERLAVALGPKVARLSALISVTSKQLSPSPASRATTWAAGRGHGVGDVPTRPSSAESKHTELSLARNARRTSVYERTSAPSDSRPR